MKFTYAAFDAGRKIQKGVIDAVNLKGATKQLIDKGWYIKKIKPRGKARVGFSEFSIGGVRLVEKVLFVKHLGTMIKSGVSMNEALVVIAEQSTSKKFKNVIEQILERVKTGQTLSSSLAKHPKIFGQLFINIIKVGEESGTLEKNLEYLAGELEERLELHRKIKAAAFYPAIVLTATLGLGLVLAYFVLPKITRLFKTLSFELPLSTKILLWTANLMEEHGLLVIFGIVGGLMFLRFISTRKFMKPLTHYLVLKSPVIGRIIINYNLAMINRTMGILLKSGLTIDQAIESTMEATENSVYKKRLKKTLPQIQKGKSLSNIFSAFKESKRKPFFPLLMIKMISVGERSGQLDESLSYLADYFEKEVDNATKNLTTILEPILLIFIGLIVGFVAISVISPIYQVTGQFSNR